MDDKDKNKFKPGMPPLPPGMAKPNLPPFPPGGKPSLPSMPQLPGMQTPAFPALPGNFQQPAPPAGPTQAQKDAADAESRRLQEEKDKLERKISDMEKLLSAEKEKALLATLKSQQDEVLSSRVETSLKDIQEKMRRDRRDHEVEEERLTLKSKIKEMESRLAQERETWMTTLKNQMSERETQGRDTEGHFIYRLQEMERRWLDEKAQWQKEISSREETIRSLKSAAERLRDVEDEFRKVSLEKSMTEREAAKLRDDVARAEREKASIEGWIKMMPEKEREIADLKAENASLRGREETSRLEASHREEKGRYETEKLQGEIGRLQAEIGTLSDRKNSEMNEALRKASEGFEAQLQEKEKLLADVSGEKIRAISELMKIKGFVARVQAINAVLEKERGQLKLEKMQLAQSMAGQLEELRKLKQESEGIKGAHQAELEAQAARAASELEKFRAELTAEFNRRHEEKISELNRARQAELAEKQAALSAAIADKQAALAAAAAEKQAELARQAAAQQAELARLSGERQADFDARLAQLRTKYEFSAEEEKAALKRQLEAFYTDQIREVRAAAAAAQETAARLEAENRRLAGDASTFDRALAEKTKHFEEEMSRAAASVKLRDEQAALLAGQKEEAERTARALEADRQRLAAEYAALREGYAALAAQKAAADEALRGQGENLKAQAENLRLEAENRSRFESELLFLKQKIQQMEFQSQEAASQLEAEQARAAALEAAAAERDAAQNARAAELAAELEKYRGMEASLGERLKWALKGKKE